MLLFALMIVAEGSSAFMVISVLAIYVLGERLQKSLQVRDSMI